MDRLAFLAAMAVVFARVPIAVSTPQLGLCAAADGSWYHCWVPPPPPPVALYLVEDEDSGDHQARTSEDSAAEDSRQPAAKFGYGESNGPGVWPLMFPECGGSRQSPVNLDPRAMLPMDALSPLLWKNYWIPPTNMTITNNGHTVEVSGRWQAPLLQPAVSGGPLSGEYVFSQLHFHWGPEDHVGSEHTVNNVSYPLEMHLVHYKKDYGGLDEALSHHDGVAVVAFFFDAWEHDNTGLSHIMTPMQVVKRAHSRSTVTQTFPLALLKPEHASEYVTYFGSLTTPPCKEVVTWIIDTTLLYMSHRQLSVFRSLSASGSMDELNFRPVQPLNHRLMFYFK